MIGIFGGTFDPVHYGHLRPAFEVQEELGIEQMHFVPLRDAPHRDQPEVSPELRCALVRAALGRRSGVCVDDRELHRDGPSYSYDTLTSFRQQLPDEPLVLLLGEDAFRGFLSWHKPLDILELAHLVVMQRPGEHQFDSQLQALINERQADSPRELHDALAGRIYFQQVTQLDISATAIRELCAADQDISCLVPDAVATIIGRLQLYTKDAGAGHSG
ncbi:nicotinate (nicotinamide) nucleotide adenylyltransferase [Solemya velum gill symbiont]|uniref:Probable nicotinate-nucleotide adenylyltransferase n=1 Tax=Solemya velum gill symbiont TaxID=2340 RepID=A0A1T2DLK1_SOVGS|nr:nicotinate-nucleotide adenylyltransferase [Solemya velum gill symbiont]OOY36226.1 nicotinate (nicotinamide) nucleotide adenylyltransferase [Solemya velum gill symbiont]OOY47951.1 nicotinate (nicotinamide) nucleotide adenylyltransferase [Solemya velum gill symbiont]OOY50892.1 nicotinate (nicotinamide) nucleotide adenylyltransferase [Solemya velum gill symbiont]